MAGFFICEELGRKISLPEVYEALFVIRDALPNIDEALFVLKGVLAEVCEALIDKQGFTNFRQGAIFQEFDVNYVPIYGK